MKYVAALIFFILHFSLNFAKQNSLGEPLRSLRSLASGYPLHHLRRASRVFGGSATIPLANNNFSFVKNKDKNNILGMRYILTSFIGLYFGLAQIFGQSPTAYLVQLRSDAVLSGYKLTPISAQWRIYALEIATDAPQVVLANLRSLPQVLTAQYDHLLQFRNRSPNDPYFNNSQLWHHDLIESAAAWENTTGGVTALGDTLVVAVIDGGCDLMQPDLQANIWYNRHEIADNQLDDDGNGYIDDVWGWNTIASSDTLPPDIHGTGVAGIIGAVGNNGIGTVGINWDIKIMNLLANYSGTNIRESQVIAAYSYIYTMRQLYNQTNGAKGAFVVVTNASFGIDRADTQDFPLWCAVFDSLGSLGILNAAATNNNIVNTDAVGDMPTACTSDFLVAVTETDRQDQLNAAYGKINIDLAAPSNIITTRPNAQYASFGGTSGATPLVSGAIALLYAYPDSRWAESYRQNPAATALLVKKMLLDNVDKLPDLENKTRSGGRLNIGNAMNKIAEYYVAPDESQFIQLSPNPTQNILQIKTANSSDKPQDIIIYDVLGRAVLRQKLQNPFPQINLFDIDVSQLAQGVYFLRWSVDAEKHTAKFIKG
jgi:hypothetical protein